MDLKDYELLPAKTVDVEDPDHLGRVKASIPGAENPSNTQIEAMPWIYPMFMTGTYQGFTKMVKGNSIWVLRNKLDNLELWYWPMHDLNPSTKGIIGGYDNPDVLVSRDMGGQNVNIFYTDGRGIVLEIGSTYITINEKAEIELSTGEGNITIAGPDIFINTNKGDNNLNATREKPLTEVLKEISGILFDIVNISSCSSNWPLSPLAALRERVQELKGKTEASTPEWRSENVYIK